MTGAKHKIPRPGDSPPATQEPSTDLPAPWLSTGSSGEVPKQSRLWAHEPGAGGKGGQRGRQRKGRQRGRQRSGREAGAGGKGGQRSRQRSEHEEGTGEKGRQRGWRGNFWLQPSADEAAGLAHVSAASPSAASALRHLGFSPGGAAGQARPSWGPGDSQLLGSTWGYFIIISKVTWPPSATAQPGWVPKIGQPLASATQVTSPAPSIPLPCLGVQTRGAGHYPPSGEGDQGGAQPRPGQSWKGREPPIWDLEASLPAQAWHGAHPAALSALPAGGRGHTCQERPRLPHPSRDMSRKITAATHTLGNGPTATSRTSSRESGSCCQATGQLPAP